MSLNLNFHSIYKTSNKYEYLEETIMGELGQFLATVIMKNFTVICNALFYFVLVAVSCMPKPGIAWSKQVLYAWFYDTMQTALPINRFLHGNQPQTTTILTVPQTAQVAPQLEEPKAVAPAIVTPKGSAVSDAIVAFAKK